MNKKQFCLFFIRKRLKYVFILLKIYTLLHKIPQSAIVPKCHLLFLLIWIGKGKIRQEAEIITSFLIDKVLLIIYVIIYIIIYIITYII